eukprot:3783305-Prorocentrum_lima.AAC.1
MPMNSTAPPRSHKQVLKSVLSYGIHSSSSFLPKAIIIRLASYLSYLSNLAPHLLQTTPPRNKPCNSSLC